MNSPSLATALFQHLQQGNGVPQIARQLGIDSSQASQAVASALPLLLGALGNNSSEPKGAQSLLNALQRDHLGGAASAGPGLDLGGILGAVLGGGTAGTADAGNGTGILGHVFGTQQPQAAEVLGRKAGLDSGRAGQLLALLAPVVMSFLAQRFAQQGNAAELGQALGEEAQSAGMAGGGLGALLDQDGDGQLGLGDVLTLGSSLLRGRR